MANERTTEINKITEDGGRRIPHTLSTHPHYRVVLVVIFSKGNLKVNLVLKVPFIDFQPLNDAIVSMLREHHY